MQSGATLLRAHRRAIALIIGIVSVLAVLAGAVAVNYSGAAKRAELRAAAGEIVAVQAQALDGLMEKFRLLPNLVTRTAPLADSLTQPASRDRIQLRLQQITALSGALDIALLSPTGEVEISARRLFADTAAANRALATAVDQGRLGREVRPFRERGRAYIFAHGLRDQTGSLTLIAAVMFDLGTLEQVWSLSTNPVIIADANGIILFSNRLGWRGEQVDSFINGPGASDQIEVARTLPQLDWTLHVLADATPVARAETQAALAVGVFALAIVAILIALANRQLAQRQRQRKDRATALRLERLVRARTSDLTRTNQALEEEVTHHKETAAVLRRTQTELIQTAKLAALGQMSTALSHEYSQPLAAAKSYADNAIQLLERGRTGEVSENLNRISQLADRMAAISRHLRNFARKPNVGFGSVPVASVINDALVVLSARLHEAGAEVVVTGERDDIWVRAGQIRLQQVIVNLVANALDASEKMTSPQVNISVETVAAKVLVAVRDFGPGLSEEVREQIFDPFFTTKGPGDGLGLGLSISFNIVKDFGGRLIAENADPGAIFTVELQRGDITAKAAE